MDNVSLENEIFNSVKFLFARPCYQGHYEYALDDIESLSIIDKESLKKLLIRLKCMDFIKINYLMDRNFPLFFDVHNKKLMEFELNSELSKEDINKIITNELMEQQKPKETSQYDKFFGKESNFYKQNFDEERLKLWQS